MEDASEDEIYKLNLYNRNPFKCPHLNVHCIRNFEFLLNHFEGLEGTYKKGYERKKIENLFSNLEFSQLYDRTFDIPDFGRTTGLPGRKSPRNNESSLQQSSFTSLKSNRSNKSKSKSKSKLNQDVSAAKLTK